jgi:hypothetical protein
MPDCRLPKLVWQHNWQEGRRQGGQVKMWDAHTREVAKSVGMEELAAMCDAADSYGYYKKQVSMAVRQRDMHVAQTDALQQSTLARYLPMLGPYVTAVPNTTVALPGWHWAYSEVQAEAAVSEWDCSCCSSQRAGHKAQQEAGDCFQPVSLLWAW